VVAQLEEVVHRGGRLRPETYALAAETLGRRHRWRDAERWRERWLQTQDLRRGGDKLAQVLLDMRLAWHRGEVLSPEALAQAMGAAESLGAYWALLVECYDLLARFQVERSLSASLLEVVRSLDGLGAPGVAAHLLLHSGQGVMHAQPGLGERLLTQSVAFAHTARRRHRFLAVLDALEDYRLAHGLGLYDGPYAADYVNLLATLDLRVRLARRALAGAQVATEGAGTWERLSIARELFVSVADDLNTALTDYQMARFYLQLGRSDEALRYVERGRAFELSARDPALSVVRQQLEKEIKQRQLFDGQSP